MSDKPEGPSIKITSDDLYSRDVEDTVERQRALRQAAEHAAELASEGYGSLEKPLSIKPPLIYRPQFYLSIAGMLGALMGWALVEPFFSDRSDEPAMGLIGLLFFPLIAGLVGLLVGCADGAVSRNGQRALLCGGVGLGIGLVGGAVSVFIANILFNISLHTAGAILRPRVGQGFSIGLLLLLVVLRGLGWAVAGTTMGLGQGIATRSGKLLLNGFLGGMLGALIGGMLFDPIAVLHDALSHGAAEGDVSRGVAFAIIGAMVGLMLGIVESISKDAWLIMEQGPLAGKQFIVYGDPTIIGGSPKAQIYLFKDKNVSPEHAAIRKAGPYYEVEDLQSRTGTRVNGQVVTRARLQHGDRIEVGSTVLCYQEKERKGA